LRDYCAGAFVEGALVEGASGVAAGGVEVSSAGFWQPVNNPMETIPNATTK
jgi:hypothetical protein